MHLICDDVQGIYVWVDDQDENLELSPHFDYVEDALIWKDRMEQLLKE
jgi:hypothetical protein